MAKSLPYTEVSAIKRRVKALGMSMREKWMKRWLPQSWRLPHQLFVLLTTLTFMGLAQAQSVIPRLAADAPDTYVVKRGDTLWDISALFLNEPWRWPELWSVNPEVRDPNLIYPGDVLALRWDNGRPRVYLGAPVATETVKLSPKMRSESLAVAIPQIPRDVIDPFLANHRFETSLDTSRHPRVLGGSGGRLIAGKGDTIYVAGALRSGGRTYDVARPSKVLYDPETGEALGQLLISVGQVALARESTSPEEASRFNVTSARQELRSGDLLFPVIEGEVASDFKLRAPDEMVASGVILSVDTGVSQIGALDVVATNLGQSDGVDAGHVLAIQRDAGSVRDPVTKQWLSIPAERAGTLMLFAVYEKASFGLILGANQPLAVGDKLVNP